MKRRTFFNLLGSATLGTIIALKLPETIAPSKFIAERSKITFQILLEAYNKYRKGAVEPTMILLNKYVYADVVELIKPHLRRTREKIVNPIFGTEYTRDNVQFMKASLIPNGFGQDENEILVITNGKIYGDMGGKVYWV